jgi:hypothetical protein
LAVVKQLLLGTCKVEVDSNDTGVRTLLSSSVDEWYETTVNLLLGADKFGVNSKRSTDASLAVSLRRGKERHIVVDIS